MHVCESLIQIPLKFSTRCVSECVCVYTCICIYMYDMNMCIFVRESRQDTLWRLYEDFRTCSMFTIDTRGKNMFYVHYRHARYSVEVVRGFQRKNATEQSVLSHLCCRCRVYTRGKNMFHVHYRHAGQEHVLRPRSFFMFVSFHVCGSYLTYAEPCEGPQKCQDCADMSKMPKFVNKGTLVRVLHMCQKRPIYVQTDLGSPCVENETHICATKVPKHDKKGTLARWSVYTRGERTCSTSQVSLHVCGSLLSHMEP